MMLNSELYQLAFRCLIADKQSDATEEIKNKVFGKEETLFRFIHLCSNHLVLPAVYIRLKKAGLTEFLPIDFNEHLNDIYALNVRRNKEILQQINEINNQLNTENIEPIFLKGTANLLDGLYANSGDRMIGDIDFLVQDKDFLKTTDLIQKLGYKTDEKIYDDIKSLKDYPRLYRNDVPADIEIHRLPVIPKYSKVFSPEVIFKEKKQIPGKINCFVPSDKHKLIHTFIHSQLSNKGYKLKMAPLRDLYDSFLLLQSVNMEEVLAGIEEKQKAKIYFDFVSILSTDQSEFENLNSKSKEYFNQHNWFMNHPKLHHFYIKFYQVEHVVVNRVFKAFFSKSVFKNLFVRISDREWWKKRFLKGLNEHLK